MENMASTLRADAGMAYGGDVTPAEAWQALTQHNASQLIDVRTQPEWMFAGLPNLDTIAKETFTISWKHYPHFDLNPDFIAQLEKAVPDKSAPLYFLCKTGGRSADAAIAATAAGYTHCYNVVGGFEGEMNPQRQRGQQSGWKAAGLPWYQA